MRAQWLMVVTLCYGMFGCQPDTSPDPAASAAPDSAATLDSVGVSENPTVFINANVWDGTGAAVRRGGAMTVADGRIVALEPALVPDGATVIDLQGRFVIPGLINTHGHINDYWADDAIDDPAERVREVLRLYARYGVTTILSLGEAPEAAFTIGDSIDPAAQDHARFYLAGPVIAETTAETARATALANVKRGVDWLKLRVDDNLGRAEKMPWEAVQAVLEVGRDASVRVATHIFYQEDTERLLAMGTGLVAHSVRDVALSDAFVAELERSGVCYVPTLTREVSTFAYAERPSFFDDPFFLLHAKPKELARVSEPEFMTRMARSEAAAAYRQALQQAMQNLERLARSDARIAFGTDSGPPARFPGYFEHLELDMMVSAGMTPEAALLSATRVAAECLQLSDVGTLEPGKWADFLVLDKDPTQDIAATKGLHAVYIAGKEIQ